MTNDTFLRDLLGGRLGDQGAGRSDQRATMFNPERRGRLLAAASHAVAATRIVLDVLDEALQEYAAADADHPDRGNPMDTNGEERRDPTTPRSQGEVKLTYDIRSESSPVGEEDQESNRPGDESEAEGN